MTFPNKESLIFFEELAKKQLPLYKDACDYGIKIGRNADAGQNVKDEARDHLQALRETYKNELTRPYDKARYPYDVDWKSVTRTTMFIPFEKDEGYFIGVRLTVYFERYTNNRLLGSANGKEPVEVLTIDISRHAQKENPFNPVK